MSTDTMAVPQMAASDAEKACATEPGRYCFRKPENLDENNMSPAMALNE